MYTSTARISVQDTGPKIDCDSPCPHCASRNPYFYRTQLAILQSKPILYEVANRLNLAEVWGLENARLSRDEVYMIVKKSVRVGQMANTSIISITVKRPDPHEAARIANEIAETYRDSRIELLVKGKRAATEAMKKMLAEQKARVVVAEKKVTQVCKELGISEDGLRALEGMETIILKQIEADRIAAQEEMLKTKALLASLEGVSAAGVVDDASPVAFDQLMVRTIQQIKEINGWLKLEGIQKDEDHPDMKRYRLQKEKMEEFLQERLDALENGLMNEYKFAQANLEKWDEKLAEIRRMETQFSGEKYKPYRLAMTNLETEQFIYNHLDKKLHEELIKLKVAPQSPVEIIDVAMPANVE